jgi:nitrogen regulatory protein PII
MHPVSRIEIIADSVELERIIKALEKEKVSSYTVIRNVVGKGVTGTVSSSFDMTNLENDYVIAFCPPDLTNSVIERLRPILNKFGGSCYVSETMQVRSTHCVASL